MKLEKMSLKNVQNKLTRKEMKSIMRGSGGASSCVSTPACATRCSDGWYCSSCFSCTGGVEPK